MFFAKKGTKNDGKLPFSLMVLVLNQNKNLFLYCKMRKAEKKRRENYSDDDEKHEKLFFTQRNILIYAVFLFFRGLYVLALQSNIISSKTISGFWLAKQMIWKCFTLRLRSHHLQSFNDWCFSCLQFDFFSSISFDFYVVSNMRENNF